MSDDSQTPSPGPFRYHLELTPAQLKITHTALHSLLDDFGHEQSDVHRVIRDVLDKLPDEHAMRAISLDTELERELNGGGAPAVLDRDDEGPEPSPDDGPGPSAA
ncbi:MAG TPA: hypothetical protein VKA36_11105 [Solirubrobacterales bacterium]|nr:hypothetical protein [Solirubrobacterales bacterium]